jgi:hypothetical protein
MKIVSCGKINIKILIPIFSGFIRLICRVLLDINPKKEIVSKNPLIISIYSAFGMSLSFIPFLIYKSRNRNLISKDNNKLIPQENRESKLSLKFEYYDVNKHVKKEKSKLILLCTLFDFSETILINAFCNNCVYNLWVFDITIISLFSYLILKKHLYKHQYLSMIIIIIFGIGLNVIEYLKKGDDDNKIDSIEIVSKFLSEVFFSLNIVINKFNMEKNFCSPYEICLWEGSINFALFSLCLLVFNYLGLTIGDIIYPENFFDYYNNFDLNDIIVILINVFASFFYNIFVLITCNEYTPCHVLIILIINESYYYFKFNENLILNITGFCILLLLLIAFLVFIEIIEFNICEISRNTIKNISIRAGRDSCPAIKNDDDSENEEMEE